MAKKSKEIVEGNETHAQKFEAPRSLAIAQKGVTTGREFAQMMSAVMSDLIEGKISPAVGNAACNAGGKLLKMVEMQHRYGNPSSGSGNKTRDLLLTEAADCDPVPVN